MSETSDLQRRLDRILGGPEAAPVPSPAAGLTFAEAAERAAFSDFVPEHLAGARELAERLIGIAGADGMEAAIAAAEELQESEEWAGEVQYALKLFVTHHPEARRALRLRPLESRQPGLVRASAPAADSPAAGLAGGGATSPEDQLDWYREDPLANEHHEHWHLVYPMNGRPGGGLGDRHGELFAYMHEQMIARYDAERLALGLGPVEPFERFREAIPQGYDPGGMAWWDGRRWVPFRARPAGATIRDLAPPFDTRPGALLTDFERQTRRLLEAGTNGRYDALPVPVPVEIDNLGNTEEANIESVDSDKRTYGNHHNDGHIHFMYFDNRQPFGVMGFTSTAIRDPIFYRWHKLVDSVFHNYQEEQLPPYDFAADAPPVAIRDEDILLMSTEGLAADTDWAAAAAEALGPGSGRWDSYTADEPIPLASGGTLELSDELTTEMRRRTISFWDAQGNPVLEEIDYLSHDDFAYLLRLTNRSDQPQSVTVRIFLAPEERVEERAAWIELDRFVARLAAGERTVLFRRSEESSVVRKPALKWRDLEAEGERPSVTSESSWCDCGWPYTLLLPRGTRQGMAFRLFVMLSPGEDLEMPPQPNRCTSLSYCGLQDKDYPDKRAMGYPFDRPFAESIAETVAARPSMAWRPVTIRRR